MSEGKQKTKSAVKSKKRVKWFGSSKKAPNETNEQNDHCSSTDEDVTIKDENKEKQKLDLKFTFKSAIQAISPKIRRRKLSPKARTTESKDDIKIYTIEMEPTKKTNTKRMPIEQPKTRSPTRKARISKESKDSRENNSKGSKEKDSKERDSRDSKEREIKHSRESRGSKESKESKSKENLEYSLEVGKPEISANPSASKNAQSKHRKQEKHDIYFAMRNFLTNISKDPFEQAMKEFKTIDEIVPDKAECSGFYANPERNRNQSIPCLDASRVQIAYEEKPDEPKYLHANKISFTKSSRTFINTQYPLPNTYEDFWYMVFNDPVSAIVIFNDEKDAEETSALDFWPKNPSQFENYGNMFVHTKRVSTEKRFTSYTIEVLPEGCSNSILVTLLHCPDWPKNKVANNFATLYRIQRQVKSDPLLAHSILVMSNNGCGRAGTYTVYLAACDRFLNGLDVNLLELCIELRKQRAYAITNVLQYVFIYQILVRFIKLKSPRNGERAVEVLNAMANALSRCVE